MAPNLIVLPEYELVFVPPPVVEPQAATTSAAASQETRRNRFISSSPCESACECRLTYQTGAFMPQGALAAAGCRAWGEDIAGSSLPGFRPATARSPSCGSP